MNGNVPEPARLITLEQAAVRLGLSAQTVWRWVARGRLPAVRLGPRCLRVRQEDIDEFVRRRTGTVRRPRGAPESTGGASDDQASGGGGRP